MNGLMLRILIGSLTLLNITQYCAHASLTRKVTSLVFHHVVTTIEDASVNISACTISSSSSCTLRSAWAACLNDFKQSIADKYSSHSSLSCIIDLSSQLKKTPINFRHNTSIVIPDEYTMADDDFRYAPSQSTFLTFSSAELGNHQDRKSPLNITMSIQGNGIIVQGDNSPMGWIDFNSEESNMNDQFTLSLNDMTIRGFGSSNNLEGNNRGESEQ